MDLDRKPALCGSQGFLTCPRHCGRDGKVGHCDDAAGLEAAVQRSVSGQDGVESVLDGRCAAAAAEYEVAEGFVFGEEGFLLGDGVAGDVAFGDAEGGERVPTGYDGAVCPAGQVRGERVSATRQPRSPVMMVVRSFIGEIQLTWWWAMVPSDSWPRAASRSSWGRPLRWAVRAAIEV